MVTANPGTGLLLLALTQTSLRSHTRRSVKLHRAPCYLCDKAPATLNLWFPQL